MTRLRAAVDPRTGALLLAGVAACLAITAAASWRAAVLALAASGALRVTRVRFCAYAALGLLLAIALAALGGWV